jgi:hypothetical protein
MHLRSKIQQQVEVDLIKRSIVATEATRDLADVVGLRGIKPVIAYDVLLAQLRGDLARELQNLETVTSMERLATVPVPFIGSLD